MTGHVAIDLGAESGRVILGVLEGDRLRLHEAHRFGNRPLILETGSHWDVAALWAELRSGAALASSAAAGQGADLVSLGVDTWGVDYGLIDAGGELIGPPYCYRDERTVRAFARAVSVFGREALYEATGIQLMPLNTLFQLIAHRDAHPDELERADRLLFMPDLFHHLLTGRPIVEATIASTSQMTDARTGRWAERLLERAGIPRHLLSEPVPPGSDLGPVRAALRAEVGVSGDVRIITPAGHDTACAVAAVPAEPGTDWCYLSCGTWSLLGAELAAPLITTKAARAPFTNEGGVDGTIRFLQNITGLWLVQQVRADLAEQGRPYDYDQLAQMSDEAEPFRTLIDPAYPPLASAGGIQPKLAELAARTNQPAPDTPGRMVRCCLESLALAYRRTLGQLEEVLGRRFSVLHVVGGGGRNRVLMRMTADAIARPVVVGPFEATAVGNILVQAMGTGHVRSIHHLRRIVSASFAPETYHPQSPEIWDAASRRFDEIHHASGGKGQPG